MRVGFNVFNPAFKAKFSKDEHTVATLKKYSAISPQDTKILVDLLKISDVDDVIAIKSHKSAGSNKLHLESKKSNGKLLNVYDCDYKTFYRTMLKVKLSNGQKVSSYLPKLSGMPSTTHKEIMEYAIKKRFDNEANLLSYNDELLEKKKMMQALEVDMDTILMDKKKAGCRFVQNYIDQNV